MTTTAVREAAQRDQQRPGIPFSRLLRVEALKAFNTRSAKWLLILTVLLSVGTSTIPIFLPDDADQSLPTYVSSASTGFSLLLPVLVILLVTTEWTQRTAMTTFALEPRRARVLTAKLVFTVLLGLVATVLNLVLGAAALEVSALLGRDVDWGFNGGRAVGLPLSMVLGMLGSFAIAALVHNTAAAIVTSFGAPTLVAVLGGLLREATEYIDVFQTSTWVYEGEWAGHVPQILTSQLIWLVLPLWLGYARTLRREVS